MAIRPLLKNLPAPLFFKEGDKAYDEAYKGPFDHFRYVTVGARYPRPD